MTLSHKTVFTLILAAVSQACMHSEQPIKPTRRDVTQAIYASGKVFPRNYYRANSSVAGYIQQIFVQVGDTVHEGQPLFSIKNEISDYNIAVASNNLSLAEANLSENSAMMRAMIQDIASAKSKYLLDSSNFIRYKNLIEQEAATPVAFDQAKTLFETSRQNYKKAVELYKSTRQKLRTDVANAQQVYLAQQTGKKDFTIKSTMNGRVYDIAGKIGEIVSPQVIVMEIGQAGAYEAELAIDETDINLVREGQEVVYSSEAFIGRYFKGKITKVYPKIGLVNKSIKALASLEIPADLKFYAGSTIEANIVFDHKEKVMVLPKVYVYKDSVRLQRDGDPKRYKVNTGISDVEFIEIVSGLKDDEEVFKP